MNINNESNTNEKFLKNLFRTNAGDVRIIWVFVIIPIYLASTLILNRLIFIIITAQFYIAGGYVQKIALEQAQTQMMTLESQAVLCAIDTLLMVLLVFLLITKIEKRNFQWSTLGLTLKSSSILYFVLGTFLGFLFIFITRGVGLVVGTNQLQPLKLEEIFTQANVKFMILFFVWAILNGFWQEIVFRGYLQTRVVERYNATVGILLVTIYFVLVHFIDRQLTLFWVIGMTLLFIIISMLFHHTKSLYLVGAMHGTINYLDQVTELIGLEWTSSPMSTYWMKNIVTLGIILGIYILISIMMTKMKAKPEMKLSI
ncbi:MAG: CPBP family intramembrane glutamic endopeptidase [Candidatus Hodarchaeales archaeon]|jgi:membrane protease YdiL (CAAX protease family)